MQNYSDYINENYGNCESELEILEKADLTFQISHPTPTTVSQVL